AAAMAQLLGNPDPDSDPADILDARLHYQNGDYDAALRAWPHHARLERNLLQRQIRGGVEAAVRAIDRKLRELLISAAQSHIFNQVLAQRMPNIATLLPGEVAQKHINGACFTVDDPAAEQSRAEAFEISPTGPMPGAKMLQPSHDALAIEQQVMSE